MTLLALVVTGIAGGLVAWAARRGGRLGTVVTVGGLVAVFVLAAIASVEGLGTLPLDEVGADDASVAALAGQPVVVTAYLRLFVGAAAVVGLLWSVLWLLLPAGRVRGAAAAPAEQPAPVPDAADPGAPFLAFAGVAALALAIAAPDVALLPAAGAGLVALLAVTRPTPPAATANATSTATASGRVETVAGDPGATAVVPSPASAAAAIGRRLGLDTFRVGAALALAITAVGLLVGRGDVIAGQPFAVGAAALTIGAAAGVRLGAFPFHAHVARLVDTRQPAALPVLLLWGPCLFAIAALAAFQASVLPLDLPLAVERGLIAGLAVLTLVAGTIGALVHDDLDHVVAYTILIDLGIALFAFASADASAWGPARAWLLIVAVTFSGLLAWALTLGRTFGTRSLTELRGWARRAPLLGVALVVLTLAAVGLPGLAAFDARDALIASALSDPFRVLVAVLALAPIAAVGRLLVVGLDRPTTAVEVAPDERLRRPARNLRRRVEASARESLDLNRAPLSALVVIGFAVVAVTMSAGLFGLRDAAAADAPAPLPGSQATEPPFPTFRPVPTDSPPPPSASPSVRASASPTARPTTRPTTSPGRTATPRPT